MTEPSRVVYRPRESATPQAELSALAAIYRYLVLEKGDRNDLTRTSIKECTTSQDKKGKENADLHGD